MKLIARFLKEYRWYVFLAIFIKFVATISELMLPRILEHIIDDLVPAGDLTIVILWGLLMFAAAAGARTLSVWANHRAIDTAHRISYKIRQELFVRTINLSGREFDTFTLPSLISRMTSDSYNVQAAVQQLQTLCVRSPIMLIGGVLVALTMDRALSMILIVMLPFLITVVLLISARGIPIYTKVQQHLDVIVRIMRENITGIRVIKALSKEDYEKDRFGAANEAMTRQDIKAASIMAVPGPFMQLCLNIALVFVVILGARRVNAGLAKPGMILAFLTYVNMITMGVMALGRIFMTMSKASASADRIDEVLHSTSSLSVLHEMPGKASADPGEHIRFDHVSFSYNAEPASEGPDDARHRPEMALEDISFMIRKGESLGIIGPTGCGKTTVINLLMRFYDPGKGTVSINGRDIRAYERDTLRRMFGTAFQNDIIFHDTLRENIRFGRDLNEEQVLEAAEDAMAGEFISELPEGLSTEAASKGVNFSGGQKQRIMVARALAAHPDILVLDDSSSALDYKTDSQMRAAIAKNHPESTLIMIAQRISSVMNMTHIMVLDDGKCIGYGTHEELMESCSQYREIYEIQMGSMSA